MKYRIKDITKRINNRGGVVKILILIILQIATIPHWLCYLSCKEKDKIKKDVLRWMWGNEVSIYIDLTYLLLFVKEFRNVFYHRIGRYKSKMLVYLPGEKTLFIHTPSSKIGGGLFIQHGFATIITAESIGENAYINQQVTIGYSPSNKNGYGKPTIGDNVTISAGAIVVGKIYIGNNARIGANCTVVKDVPANSTIISSPTMILTPEGKEPL